MYAVLAKGYGWDLEKIKEMTEIEVYQAAHNLDRIEKKKTAEKLNEIAISTAAGFGSKEANQKIKKITNEIESESKREQFKETLAKGKPQVDVPMLSKEHLNDIFNNVEFTNGGQRKRP